jgi:hypothetical protein
MTLTLTDAADHRDNKNAPPPPAPPTPEQVVAWLDYELEPLIRRRDDEVLPALRSMAEAHPEIPEHDDELAGQFAENVRIAKTLIRTATAREDEVKRPFNDGRNTVIAWFRRFAGPLTAQIAVLERILLDQADRREATARRQAEAEAQRRHEEAQRAMEAAQAALRRNTMGGEHELEDAARAAEAATQAAIAAQQKPAAFTRTRGIYGAVASVRTTWAWEVEDFAKVPREFLMVDPGKVREAAKRRHPVSGKPLAEIPGIRWVEQRAMGVR